MKNIASVDIAELIEQFGSPLYVYDKEQIERNYMKLKNAFEKNYQSTKIHYSVKANSNPNILRIFNDLGSGTDCSSPIELLLSAKSGFSKDNILYTGNYESEEDLEAALKYADRINLDDINSFDRLMRIGKPNIISFRINPGIGRGGFEGITTAGSDAKFGVPYEKAKIAYQKAIDSGIERFGIHIMTGSNNLEPYYFAEIVEKLMMIAGNLFKSLNIKPEYIDIGGGFGVPYEDDEEELNIDLTAQLISEVLLEKLQKYDLGTPELLIEPGRYLVANAGYLLSKVIGLKNSYKNFAGIDAGMTTLLRPALYGAKHRAMVYAKTELQQNINICGQICENSDILLKSIFLPTLEEGDILILRDAGAYGFVMSSNYNNRPRPAEVLVDGDKYRLIRQRETADDLLSKIVW